MFLLFFQCSEMLLMHSDKYVIEIHHHSQSELFKYNSNRLSLVENLPVPFEKCSIIYEC